MSQPPMAHRVAKVLGENPDLAFEFYCVASEVVDDFDDYGPVLQADEDRAYTEQTTIRRLRTARNSLIELIRKTEIRPGP